MSGTRPQANSETTRYEAERIESGSAGKEHEQLKNEHECPKCRITLND
jgi:rubredoxin